jgi:hypothetical protein
MEYVLYVPRFFNNALSSLDYIASGDRMIYKLEIIWKEGAVADLKHSPSISLRAMWKNVSQDIRSSGRYLNPGPPAYEAGVLTTWSRYFLNIYTVQYLSTTYLY